MDRERERERERESKHMIHHSLRSEIELYSSENVPQIVEWSILDINDIFIFVVSKHFN
jgi:hypothetical protein